MQCDICVWSCCNKCDADVDGLERLQRRAAKIVSMLSSSDTAMQILKWVPLEIRRDKHVCKLVKKCLKNNVPQFLQTYFTLNREVRTEAAKTAFFIMEP